MGDGGCELKVRGARKLPTEGDRTGADPGDELDRGCRHDAPRRRRRPEDLARGADLRPCETVGRRDLSALSRTWMMSSSLRNPGVMPASGASSAWPENSGASVSTVPSCCRTRSKRRSSRGWPASRSGPVTTRTAGGCSSPTPSAGRRRSAGFIRSITISRWSGRSAACPRDATSASGPEGITTTLRNGSAANSASKATAPWIGIAPGAAYGPAKRWFPERFAAVADRLGGESGAQVILFGSAGDRESTAAVQRKRPASADRHRGKDESEGGDLADLPLCPLHFERFRSDARRRGAGDPDRGDLRFDKPRHDIARRGEERRDSSRRAVRPLPEAGLPDRFSLHGDDRRGGGLRRRAEVAGRFG